MRAKEMSEDRRTANPAAGEWLEGAQESPHWPELSLGQQKAVVALVGGLTVVEAAREAGVHRNTVHC